MATLAFKITEKIKNQNRDHLLSTCTAKFYLIWTVWVKVITHKLFSHKWLVKTRIRNLNLLNRNCISLQHRKWCVSTTEWVFLDSVKAKKSLFMKLFSYNTWTPLRINTFFLPVNCSSLQFLGTIELTLYTIHLICVWWIKM